jgi:predicted nucleic acid-binding protein
MHRYLLDTSVVSALAPDRRERLTQAAEWLRAKSELMCLSTMTLLEVRQGIARLNRLGSVERAIRLEHWLRSICEDAEERIVLLDTEIALEAGNLSDAAIAKGTHPGIADLVIAATAKVRNLDLLTRNVRHFEPLGIKCQDPFDTVR